VTATTAPDPHASAGQRRPTPLHPVTPPGHTARAAHAVVIGAGFGGIAAALRLRARGLRVTLVDNGAQLGGRARVFRDAGYTFDAGPTVITAPFLLEELFALFGENLHDHAELRPIDPWYRVVWEDGASFDYAGGIDRMCDQIARFEPLDADGYRRMMARAGEIYRIGFERLGDHPFDRPSDMIRAAPDMIRLGARRSMYRFVAAHLRNERLREVFTFQPLLIGGNPYKASCIYALIQPLEQRFGVHYAMGGTGAVIEALGGLLERAGVNVTLGERVARVETDGRERATGVTLEAGRTIDADVVVSNADPVRLYSELLPARGPHATTRRRAGRMKLSMGLFVTYFGASTTYPRLAHHTILLSDRYRPLLEDIFERGTVPRDPSIYLHAPTRTDSTMAPDGHECFYALAPVPNLRTHRGTHEGWSHEDAERYRELVLERIERIVAPGLRDRLDIAFQVTPRYFESRLESEAGAGFGVQPLLSQSAYFRFHNRCPHYRNLFLVGAGTHPGAGIPGTLCTAKATERCLEREGVFDQLAAGRSP